MTTEQVRSFVAFEIDPGTKERIGRFAERLREQPGGADLRWVRPEILHMTVRFFGDLDRKRLAKAREAMIRLDRAWESPSVALGRLGGFPSLRKARVLWLGLEDPEGALQQLGAEVDRTIRQVGFGRADKPFVAHLTLARLRRGGSTADLERLIGGLTPPVGPLTIRTITLFRSDLLPEGPRYTPIEIARPRSEPSELDGRTPPDPEIGGGAGSRTEE